MTEVIEVGETSIEGEVVVELEVEVDGMGVVEVEVEGVVVDLVEEEVTGIWEKVQQYLIFFALINTLSMIVHV